MSNSSASGLMVVLGTRPEIIKLAPVIREVEHRGIENYLVHTGQHYTESLDEAFFESLDLDAPDTNLSVGSGSHGEQTGELLAEIESEIVEREPAVVIVQGDTNSVLAGALAASKLPPTLGHVEAGLRSYDRNMPEEVNRRLTDHASDYLFPPTEEAASNLKEESLGDRHVKVTGNTVVDAVLEHKDIAMAQSNVLDAFDLESEKFVLFTAHRSENVDDPERFEEILAGVGEFADDAGLPVLYPVHPRSRERLDNYDIRVPERIVLSDPLDYLDFLRLEMEAQLIVTDSGGVQEEACILQVPSVTVRTSTERPETISVGANKLSGIDADSIRSKCEQMMSVERNWANPFGDGDAAELIVDTLAPELQ